MTANRLHRRQAAQRLVDSQVRWIDEHGGTRAGYAKRYGEAQGAAIWEADIDRLTVLRAQLADVDLPQMARPPKRMAEPVVYLEPPAYLTGQAPARYRAPQIETMTTHLSDGSVIEIEIGEASCAKCGEHIIRIGQVVAWQHGNELVGRPRRSYLGGRYDHDARP